MLSDAFSAAAIISKRMEYQNLGGLVSSALSILFWLLSCQIGWSNLVKMVYAVWFNLILEDSVVGWFGVL